MVINATVLGIVLVAGLVVAFGGYNLFRYSVIIMGGVGGFFLGNMFFTDFLSDMVGEGIFHAMKGSSGASFVVALVMLATMALSYAFYSIMAPIIAGVGGGFMGSALMSLAPGADTVASFSGFVIGLVVGIILGVVAVSYQRWVAIIFTALSGSRIVAYAAAKLLATTSIGTAIGNPLKNAFYSVDPAVALEMALFIELFIFVAIAGVVVQFFTRAE